MIQRFLTGIVLAGGWICLLLFSDLLLFWMVITIISLLMGWEYFSMVLPEENRLTRALLIAIATLPVLASFSSSIALVFAGAVVGLLCLCLVSVFLYAQLSRPLHCIVSGGFGIGYIGIFTAHYILLWNCNQGWKWLLYLTAIVAASDTGAYLTGSFFGRHTLCPTISPKKTVEGLTGGLVLALITALLFKQFVFNNTFLVPVAVLLSLLSVVGDLTESILKRACNIKDSSSLLPGHGGILDRVDGLLTTTPALFYLVYYGII